jgi:hypothetical protein
MAQPDGYLPQEAVDYADQFGFKDPGRPAIDNVIVAQAYAAGMQSNSRAQKDSAMPDEVNG